MYVNGEKVDLDMEKYLKTFPNGTSLYVYDAKKEIYVGSEK